MCSLLGGGMGVATGLWCPHKVPCSGFMVIVEHLLLFCGPLSQLLPRHLAVLHSRPHPQACGR